MVEVEHFSRFESEHAPLLISCCAQILWLKFFSRFLIFWTEKEYFLDVVRNNWVSAESDVFIDLKQKLKKS